MFLDGDIDSDSSGRSDLPSRTWAITIGAAMLPIYVLFSSFGMVGKGNAAALAAGTLVFAVKMHARLMGQFWFWGVILSIAAINALLIAFIPFPNRNYTFAIVAPFGYLDYLIISFCIRFLEKRLRST